MRYLPAARLFIVTLACIIGLKPAHAAMPAVVKAKCMICHSFAAGEKHKIGPNLYGVVGRKAGTATGYRYSTALNDAGFIWTPARLRVWLVDPKKLLSVEKAPAMNTRMPPQKLSGAQVDEVVAYLSTLSPTMKKLPMPAESTAKPKSETKPAKSMPAPAESTAMPKSAPRPKPAPTPAKPMPAPAESTAMPKTAADDVSSPSEIFAEVDRILSGLPEGNIAFNAPTTMNLEKTATIQLILSMQKTIEELKAALKGEGAKEGGSIKVARQMEARLTGADFQITAIRDEEQLVSYVSSTEWRWEVKPVSTGSHQLHLTLSIVLDDKSRRPIRTFDKVIMVQVTPQQRLEDFVANNWQWLWTVILVPLAGWFWRRGGGKKAA